MADTYIFSLLLHSGVFYSTQEKQPGVIFTCLPSCNHDSKLVDGSKVLACRTV